MGGKCCTDRKNDGPATAVADRHAVGHAIAGASSGSGNKDRKQSHGAAFDGKKRALSIGYQNKDDDAYKFDQAFEAQDLKTFVKLLASNQPLDAFEDRIHPWAEDPKTVGALAGTQLAIMASVAEKENPGIKHEISEAGGIPPLVGFLKSGQKDRVETAVVALSFLTADCPQNTVQIYKEGAMPELMKHLDSPVAGMRAAAATTLRNMCCVEGDEGEVYRKEFVKQGGIKGLVSQLASAPDPTLNYADVQLEAVLNIQDLIEDENGDLIPEFAKEALKHGVKERLMKLVGLEQEEAGVDEEVRTSAQEVLDALEALEHPHP